MDDYNKELGQSPYGETVGSGATGTAPAREKIVQKTAEIKEKVSNFGRQAVDKLDQSRQTAAEALDQTASTLHSSGDKVSGAAHSAADSIQATANYVRRTDLKGMGQDIQDLVTRYPGASLAAAAVLGFLVARGLRGND